MITAIKCHVTNANLYHCRFESNYIFLGQTPAQSYY